MSKDWRTILRFAAAGFAITGTYVLYQVLTDSSPPPPPNMLVLTLFTILCPSCLLTVPPFDIEIGTPGFYPLWTIVAIINAMLYAIISAVYVGLRNKSQKGTR